MQENNIFVFSIKKFRFDCCIISLSVPIESIGAVDRYHGLYEYATTKDTSGAVDIRAKGQAILQ